MAVVAGTPDPNQPQWALAIPETLRNPVAALIARQDAEDQKLLLQAIAFVDKTYLTACETPEAVLDLIKMTAEAMLTDQQTNYLPAVWTIDHRDQRWKDDQGYPLGDEIQGVIVYHQPTRGFFIEGRKQPLCSAIGTWLRGRAAPDAQEAWSKYNLYNPEFPITWSGQEHDCTTCPFNEFGSDPKTGAGKACKEKYRTFLAPVADGQFTGEGVMLNIPSTSLKGMDEHVSKLRRYKAPGSRTVEPKTTLHVVTSLKLSEAVGQSQVYSKINLKTARLLTFAEFQAMYNLRKQIASVAETIDIAYGESYDQQAPEGEGAAKPAGPDEYDEKLGF